MIKVSFSHELGFKPNIKAAEKKWIEEFVNDQLRPIELDCVAFNASVNAIVTKNDCYKFEARCDQYSTLSRMIELLPEAIPRL